MVSPLLELRDERSPEAERRPDTVGRAKRSGEHRPDRPRRKL